MNWDEIMEIKNPNEAFLAIEKKIWEEDLSLEEMENRIEEYLNRYGIDIETMTTCPDGENIMQKEMREGDSPWMK